MLVDREHPFDVIAHSIDGAVERDLLKRLDGVGHAEFTILIG